MSSLTNFTEFDMRTKRIMSIRTMAAILKEEKINLSFLSPGDSLFEYITNKIKRLETQLQEG